MIRFKNIILVIVCLIFAGQVKGDSWIDPSWQRMLDNSDIIALVQYTGSGEYRAAAKILTAYKGELKSGDEIFISGFSNRYGPIDKMHAGDKYLVFLSLGEPDEDGLEYWNKELAKDAELKDYVEAYKNRRVYYVWSPTSGDLRVKGKSVQYDLLQSTYYGRQGYYSLKEFETFLRAREERKTSIKLGDEILRKIKRNTERDIISQYLMQMYFLGYDKYDGVFESLVKVDNPATKIALAQLMGNIKTVQSRNILISILNDDNSFVQGEVVRQLINEPAEIVAPILLERLKSSSGENFGPSNLMDPVMNRIDGGKVEIIKALGELKYKPAIPDLLLLLTTEEEYIFKLVIEALKSMGSSDYVEYLNKHLENKTHKLIFDISMMIAQDSLVDCLPDFKRFISSCDRNRHPDYDYTISTSSGIGHFRDSATISFLISDYERFFTYKDTLLSSKQKSWTGRYIQTFSDLKVLEARPLIYKSIFDWYGLSQDFGKYPMLFEIKRQLEDSLRKDFENRLGGKGYELNHCIAFIQNIPELIAGAKPKVKFLMEASIPSTENGNEYKEIIMNELNLPNESVYIRFSNGWYFSESQERFINNFSLPMGRFLDYAKAIPNWDDVHFLQGVLENKIFADDHSRKMLARYIDEISVILEERSAEH